MGCEFVASEIKSIDRCFSVLEYLSTSAKALPLKQIASACDLPVATTHRFLDSLISLGYVAHEIGGYYKLTYKLLEVASRNVSRSSLISIAKPHLDKLSERLHESVHLVVRDNTDILYVYKVTQIIGSIQMASRIGMRLPMYRTAVGKAILSTLSDSEIKEIFEESEIIKVTDNTVTTIEALMAQIHKTRITGYAFDDEENEKGILCIGTTLGRAGDAINYAFSVSSLKSRMTPERIEEISSAIMETKSTIEAQLLI